MLAQGKGPGRGRGGTLGEAVARQARRVLLWSLVPLAGWGYHAGGAALAARAARADAPYEGLAVAAGTLGKRPLYDAIVASGSSASEAGLLSRALSRLVRGRSLRPEDSYRIVRSTDGTLRHLTVVHALKRYVVVPRGDGYAVSSGPVPLLVRRRMHAGVLRQSLWVSMESGGVPGEVIAGFADAFRWSVDFLTEPRDGDRFAVTWTETSAPEAGYQRQEIEAALYEGSASGRQEAIRFGGEFYDGKGDSLKRMFLRAPLQYRHISSRFSRRRRHPILRVYRPHHGIDYSAPRGVPVVSVADGRVVFAARKGGYGNQVQVRHTEAYTTVYAHLSRFARGVSRGARVRQGQVIGYVGSTGLATAPHLHFEIRERGRPRDYMSLNLPFASSVPSRWRPEFMKVREKLLAEMRLAMDGNDAVAGL